MKKKLFIAALFLNLSVTPAISSLYSTSVVKAAETENPGIQPYTEKTRYKYKVINGRLHKRLWSFEHNKWLEPKWTPVD
ncbi:MAG: hypothetical protein HFH68_12065 [Lachnospiraceae bacterium]|nr:hypothetical protein [Lachnospiraceae bacterium]